MWEGWPSTASSFALSLMLIKVMLEGKGLIRHPTLLLLELYYMSGTVLSALHILITSHNQTTLQREHYYYRW